MAIWNLSGIKAALGHNADVTIRRVDGVNHLFQTARTGVLAFTVRARAHEFGLQALRSGQS